MDARGNQVDAKSQLAQRSAVPCAITVLVDINTQVFPSLGVTRHVRYRSGKSGPIKPGKPNAC